MVLLVVGMFLGMISPKVFAQEVGSTNIIGKVVDQYGNPVSDVTITMKNSDLKVITGIDGVFTFQMKKEMYCVCHIQSLFTKKLRLIN